MNRPVATLELYDTSQAPSGSPLLRLQMPILTRGASVLSFQLAYNPHTGTHDHRSPFYTDPSATVIVVILRVMAPSAEGTGTETVIFIMPVARLEQLVEQHAIVGTSLTWTQWGPSSTRVLTIPDSDVVPDWVLRSSIHGFYFAFATHGTVCVFNVNSAMASNIDYTKGWSVVDAKVDIWAFEDIVRSNVQCWQCSINISSSPLALTASWALLEENHLFVIPLVCPLSYHRDK
jgi:hypothetical protein